jgi:hypothetical protein
LTIDLTIQLNFQKHLSHLRFLSYKSMSMAILHINFSL